MHPLLRPPRTSARRRVDGYTVSLKGDLAPGADSALTLSVSRGGKPVTDLDPYLGAFGHLVALRTGDLAYLHVHPEGHPGDGTTTARARTSPSARPSRARAPIASSSTSSTKASSARPPSP